MSVPAVRYWDGAYDVHDLPHGDGIMTLFNREGNAFAVEQQTMSHGVPTARRRLHIDPASKHGQCDSDCDLGSQGDSDCDLVQDNDQGAKAKVSRRDDPARPPSRLEGALPLASTLVLPRADADRCQVPPQACHPGMPLSTPDSDQDRGAVHATSVRPTLVVPAAPPARERQGLGTAECRITIEELRPYFHLSLSVAAEVLGHW